MISVAEAVAKVTAGVDLLPTEQVSLIDGLGRVLARDVTSRVTQPFADVSAMDGYAVRAEDVATVPATLTRIGESAAGRGFDGAVGSGQAVRIFTGAPVPPGADTIVIQEDTDADGEAITVNEGAAAGRYIRKAGMDFAEGQVLLTAGRILTARDIGMAAAMNVPWLTVRRRPRVAVLATGDEIVMPGDPLGPDQILSSNSIALGAYVRVLGGEPIDLGIARDDEDSLRSLAAGMRGADLLVTIGGASVGDHDLVRKVLGDEGLKIDFFSIAMRPGKPLIFGHLNGVPMLGLPGNPVSAGVCSVVYMRPMLRVMLGLPTGEETTAAAVLGRDVGDNDRREDYLRARLERASDGQLVATPFDRQDSNLMALFSQADCLVIRPPFAPPAKKGEAVRILPLDIGAIAI